MLSRAILRRLTPDVIQQALAERARLTRLEAMAQKRRKLMVALAVIEKEMAKLDGSPAAPVSKPRRRRWKLSPATREKMRQAALRRYAGKSNADAPKVEHRKRTLSAAGRAAISAAAKARWERIRAAKGEAVV